MGGWVMWVGGWVSKVGGWVGYLYTDSGFRTLEEGKGGCERVGGWVDGHDEEVSFR